MEHFLWKQKDRSQIKESNIGYTCNYNYNI